MVTNGARSQSGGFDPLLLKIDLPIEERFYPLGFPLDLSTNAPEVLYAARESWSFFTPAFDIAPLTLRLTVLPGSEPVSAPVFRAQGHLTVAVAGRADFAVCDRRTSFGFCFVQSRTAADRTWFRWHFLEAMTYILLSQNHALPVHAACVARQGSAVLLCGPSGAGKSTVAFACARDGWQYLGDDSVMLLLDGDELIAVGKPHCVRLRDDAGVLFPELAGAGPTVRPNGKKGLELSTVALPGFRLAPRCRIAAVVFLHRRPEGTADLKPLSGSEAVSRIAREMPEYEPEVSLRHARMLERLAALPACELHYGAFADAVQLLDSEISSAAPASAE